MATPIVMPRLSETMTEGKIVKWNKKEGDEVQVGEALAEIETDKATLDLEAFEEGTLLKIRAAPGEKVPVGATVAIIGRKGEEVSLAEAAPPSRPEAPPPQAEPERPRPPAPPARAAIPSAPAVPPARPPAIPSAPPPPLARAAAPSAAAAPPTPEAVRAKASPLARRMAREAGIDLSRVRGTGPAGRVVARDVEEAARRPAAAPPAEAAAPRPAAVVPSMMEVPERPAEGLFDLSTMRQIIASRMSEAKREAPHFYLSVEVDMVTCTALRAELKAVGASVSFNDFVIKAAGFGLARVSEVNRSFEQGRLRQHGHIDVSMAVALPEGLMTPVIHDVDRLSLTQVASQARELAERARNKKLVPEEYQGGSVTVSNLGMYGMDTFLAILNPPQSVVLAIGQVSDRPAVVEGQLTVRKRMWVTLSGDHRVIDGATGARYLAEVKAALEHPMVWMA
jgi:pyruvate dehydrogenase E2 component (dihydrolipoamide acetyltransferase)